VVNVKHGGVGNNHPFAITLKKRSMETQFYIMITLKTINGLENFGKFYIGNDRSRAAAIFNKVKGSTHNVEKNVLYMEFMETIKGLPVNLDVISCTLDQMAENCKTITKELFITRNLVDRN
jgi:hypothetical protein